MSTIVFKPRFLEEADYNTLVGWWKHYNFPVPAQHYLPENGTCGIMLEDEDGVQYAAGFVYLTNSPVAWIELIVSNPEIHDKEVRKEMISELIRTLTEMAEDNDAGWVFTSIDNKNLIERFKENGYHAGSGATTELIKRL